MRLHLRLVVVALLATQAAGCISDVRDHCADCTVIHWTRLGLPAFRPTTRTVVVLVPGAFGFGEEWTPVVAALRERPGVEFVVFWYRGFARGPARIGDALARFLDGIERGAPPSVEEVVVFGHSFGGLLSTHAAHHVSPPPGRKLLVYAIDPPRGITILRERPERTVNTPLGVAVGEVDFSTPVVAPRVELTSYCAGDPEGAPPPVDERRVWLGKGVTHDGSVPLVALPVIAALPR